MKRPLILGAAALTAGLAITAVGAVAQAATDPLDPATIVAELGEPQGAQDAIPSILHLEDVGIGGIDPTTVRDIGADQQNDYWVAQDAAGSICLVVAFGQDEFVAATCGRPSDVERTGLAVGFQAGGTKGSVAYLLPEGSDTTGLDASWRVVGDSIVVGPADGGAAANVEIAGHPVQLRR